MAAKIGAPGCVQTEQLQDLGGRKLDAIRLFVPAENALL